uniref:Uncharacterized protein n=1 Tax=Kalanchoe fedtschenkoi TaxID=63787 RepID=A0A7N0TAA7_KALFE
MLAFQILHSLRSYWLCRIGSRHASPSLSLSLSPPAFVIHLPSAFPLTTAVVTINHHRLLPPPFPAGSPISRDSSLSSSHRIPTSTPLSPLSPPPVIPARVSPHPRRRGRNARSKVGCLAAPFEAAPDAACLEVELTRC